MIKNKILRCSLQMGLIKTTSLVFGLVTFALTASCSLEPKNEQSKIKVIIPGTKGAPQFVSLSSSPNQPSIRTTSGIFYPPPTSVTSFDCYYLNIIGPGIPSRILNEAEVNPDALLPSLYAGTSPCSYPGIVSKPVPVLAGEQIINIQVPVGGARIIQLMGATTSATGNDFASCPQEPFPLNGSESPYDFEFYLISQATVDLFSDKAITLPNTYNDAGVPNYNYLRKHVACNPPLNISYNSASVCNSTTISAATYTVAMNNVSSTPTGGFRMDVTGVVAKGADGTNLSVGGTCSTAFFDFASDTCTITINGSGTSLIPIQFYMQLNYPTRTDGVAAPSNSINFTKVLDRGCS